MRRKARVEVEIPRTGIKGRQSFWFVLSLSFLLQVLVCSISNLISSIVCEMLIYESYILISTDWL